VKHIFVILIKSLETQRGFGNFSEVTPVYKPGLQSMRYGATQRKMEPGRARTDRRETYQTKEGLWGMV
jgi:hypothetical protein